MYNKGTIILTRQATKSRTVEGRLLGKTDEFSGGRGRARYDNGVRI